jgi:hypothetical protein
MEWVSLMHEAMFVLLLLLFIHGGLMVKIFMYMTVNNASIYHGTLIR